MKEKQEEQPAVEEMSLPDPGFLKQYRECYPGIKHFHVTGDNLVFFERDYEQAVSHQRSIGKGELKTY